jgi:hypothetical protein
MIKILNRAVSIFLAFVIMYAFYALVKIRTLNVFFILTVNNILSVCGLLLFINYSHIIGTIINLVSFLILVLIGIFFLPERLLRFSTIFRLVTILCLIYQIIFFDKRNRKRIGSNNE